MTADKTHHDADINPDYSALVDAAVLILTTAKSMISSVYPMHSRIGAALDNLVQDGDWQNDPYDYPLGNAIQPCDDPYHFTAVGRGDIAQTVTVPKAGTYHFTLPRGGRIVTYDGEITPAHYGSPPIKIKDAMLVPEVAALVMAANRARREAAADEMDEWFADLGASLRTMEGGA